MVVAITDIIGYINYYGSFYDTICKTLNLAANSFHLFDSDHPNMLCLGRSGNIATNVYAQGFGCFTTGPGF